MKSVLRDLRHLAAFPTLAPWADLDDDGSVKGSRIAVARAERSRRASAEAQAALHPALRGYLLGRQHDAWIQSFRREGDRLTITVHDEDLAGLAATIYGVPWGEAAMPFDLVFEGVRYAGWRHVEDGGGLTFASAPRHPVEWLDDEILPADGPGVRWGLLYYVSGIGSRTSGRHLLLVEATNLRLVERQREAWRARFGDCALAVYDAYAPLRPELPLTYGKAGPAWMEDWTGSHAGSGD